MKNANEQINNQQPAIELANEELAELQHTLDERKYYDYMKDLKITANQSNLFNNRNFEIVHNDCNGNKKVIEKYAYQKDALKALRNYQKSFAKLTLKFNWLAVNSIEQFPEAHEYYEKQYHYFLDKLEYACNCVVENNFGILD